MNACAFERACATLFVHLAPRDAPGQPAYDLIVGFGVCDLSVPDACVRLWQGEVAPTILFTGGVGAGSGHFTEPEAEVFRRHAVELGVDPGAILIEPDSTNTLDNIVRTRALLVDRGLPLKRAVLVAQPHRQRRVWLTCRRQLPGVTLCNRPPDIGLQRAAEAFGGMSEYAASMLGELERIKRYGGYGDLVRDPLSPAIEQAAEQLRRTLSSC